MRQPSFRVCKQARNAIEDTAEIKSLQRDLSEGLEVRRAEKLQARQKTTERLSQFPSSRTPKTTPTTRQAEIILTKEALRRVRCEKVAPKGEQPSRRIPSGNKTIEFAFRSQSLQVQQNLKSPQKTTNPPAPNRLSSRCEELLHLGAEMGLKIRLSRPRRTALQRDTKLTIRTLAPQTGLGPAL